MSVSKFAVITAAVVIVALSWIVFYAKVERIDKDCKEIIAYIESSTKLSDGIEEYNKKVISFNDNVSANHKKQIKQLP